ncbi:MAG: metal-dependent phosphohydrolase [Pseudomonadota bacterium]
MFRPSKIIIDAFVQRMESDYREIYGDGPPGHLDTVRNTARMAFSRLVRSNALYHNLAHTLLVTRVGSDMLRGKLYRDGNVTSRDWTHFMVSLVTFALGFTRNLVRGDHNATCVTGNDGKTIELPRGATDAMLWPYFTERGKCFVREYFANHYILDPDAIAENIEYARFPPSHGNNPETESYPGLLRAAQVIGSIADPDFSLKMTPLWLELKECGLHESMGYQSAIDVSETYPQFFWDTLHPLIGDGIDCLTYTGSGRLWLANMHSHVLLEEHRDVIAGPDQLPQVRASSG